MIAKTKAAPVLADLAPQQRGTSKLRLTQPGESVKENSLTVPNRTKARKRLEWRDRVPQVVIDQFRERYVHRAWGYGVHLSDGSMPQFNGRIEDRDIALHLTGERCLVVWSHFSRKADGKEFSRWLSWDVDFLVLPPNERVFQEWAAEILAKMRSALRALGVDESRLYAYATGGKGLRPELHLSKPINLDTWRKFWQLVLDHGGEGQRLSDMTDVRFERRPDGKNPVRPPLGRHAVTGNPGQYLDPQTGGAVADQWGYLAGIQTVEPEAIETSVRSVKARPSKDARSLSSKGEATEQRRHLDAVLEGFLPGTGTRHGYFPMLAARLRELGRSQEEAGAIMTAWTLKQVDAGLVDSPRVRWAKDLESTVERVYAGKFKLKTERRRVYVTDAEVTALLVPVKKPASRRVMAHLLRFGKSVAGPDGRFFITVAQVARSVFGDERRKGHVSDAIRDLLALGVLEKPPEIQQSDDRIRMAAVYRFPTVKEKATTTFPVCSLDKTCDNCPSVLLHQLLSPSELRVALSRRTAARVEEEAHDAPCISGIG